MFETLFGVMEINGKFEIVEAGWDGAGERWDGVLSVQVELGNCFEDIKVTFFMLKMKYGASEQERQKQADSGRQMADFLPVICLKSILKYYSITC